MDRFSEQITGKVPDGKDMFLRGLIVAGVLLIIGLMVFLCMLTQFTAFMFCVAIVLGAIFLAKYLFEGTMIEYEYIVTNDDLDIDKIIGKRKRKRLITVDLKSVTEMGLYANNELKSDVTVMAHDNTGEDLWYIVCNSAKHGVLAVLFNPDSRTRENMIGGFEPKLKAKYLNEMKIADAEALPEKEEEQTEDSWQKEQE
ncbi:MAG: hypothetical protein ACI4J4_10735 [Ruminiclostridium sp.]